MQSSTESKKPAGPSRITRLAFLGLSVATTVFCAWLVGWAVTLAVVGMYVLHEFGHAIVVYSYSRRFPVMLLVPPFFGLTYAVEMTGRPAHEQLAVKMGGIWLSLVVALALMPLAPASDWLYAALLYAVFNNGLNLIPIPGLDGGAICHCLIAGRSRPGRVALTLLLVSLGFLLALWLNTIFVWALFGMNTMVMLRRAARGSPAAGGLPARALLAWVVAQVLTFSLLLHLMWILLSMGQPLVRVSRALGI